MDREEQSEIAYHREHGLPETTRGPYYHKTWWESYKGAVKGMLGGLVIGGIIGAAAGGVIVGALAIASGGIASIGGGVTIGGILAATTAFGMYEGEKKFEKVGTTTGAVAAAAETSEVRMKEYMRDKLTDLTNEVRELKAAVAGEINKEDMHVEAVAPDTAPIFDESDYRATHQTGENQRGDRKIVYWNVAGIGAAVGALAAGIAGIATPIPATVAHLLGDASSAAGFATVMASGAALGGSFGVSRDIFRRIFDVTDCWFMGVANAKCSNEEIAASKGQEFEPLPPHQTPRSIAASKEAEGKTLIVPESVDADTPSPHVSQPSISGGQHSRYFDRGVDSHAARHALLNMDHTNSRMH